MIIILKKGAEENQVNQLLGWLKEHKVTPHITVGEHDTIIGCVGDVAHMDIGLVRALDVVDSVQRIQEPYKAANRKFHPDDTVVDCGGQKIGGAQSQTPAMFAETMKKINTIRPAAYRVKYW